MTAMELNLDVRAVVVANRRDSFRWGVTFLLDRLGVGYVLCDDVYCATSELATSEERDGKMLIIGSLEELSREDMRFFEICPVGDKTKCCCFINGGSRRKEKKIVAAIRAGVFVAGDARELEQTVEGLLANWQGYYQTSGGSRSAGNSRTEIDALSGTI